ncbi:MULTISPECIES: bacteriohemerythrin [Caproicibacterium]|uniref:Bacteriohemerythrin n=1 Tax=Caproicibacterium argilliputei TaxID=3030016 RepID=A0AA97D879_9FIRM|nr:bacteriohemerythrin [Caproicibacterium argilliputei]WOC32134.1 bacteriohemerythrin [Caproicibacterium argilliputei]
MYQWTKDLETGNATIDSEHKELIQAVNTLLEACAKGKGRAEIQDTLRFLKDYVSRHFSHEEKLQLESQYPDYANHKRYHEGFKKTVQEIATEYEQGGATIPLVAKVNQSIAGWLLNHIKREDVKVAAHIRAQQK